MYRTCAGQLPARKGEVGVGGQEYSMAANDKNCSKLNKLHATADAHECAIKQCMLGTQTLQDATRAVKRVTTASSIRLRKVH